MKRNDHNSTLVWRRIIIFNRIEGVFLIRIFTHKIALFWLKKKRKNSFTTTVK